MPDRNRTGVASGVEAGEMIDSLIVSGSPQSLVAALLAGVPARFREQEEVVPVIDQMRQTERQVLPLMRELQQNSIGNDVQRLLPRMMFSLFLVGLAACLSLAVGMIAFLIAALLGVIYLVVRGQAIRDLRQEAQAGRDDLIKHWLRLTTLEKRWMEQEKTG